MFFDTSAYRMDNKVSGKDFGRGDSLQGEDVTVTCGLAAIFVAAVAMWRMKLSSAI